MSVNATNRSILSNYLLGQGSSSTQGRNYVRNEFARDGVANVTASGTATVAKNTTTPLTAISDFLITLPNNATDYVEWALDTLDNSLTNQNCQLTLDYKIGSIGSVVQAQVLIGGVVSNSRTINASPTQSSLSLNVPCGDLSGATTIRISNAAGNTGTSSINVANVNYGKATNIGTGVLDVSASYYASTSGSVSSTQPANFDTKVYDTNNAVTTGSGWKFTAPVPGKYHISGMFNDSVGAFWTLYKNGTAYANLTSAPNSSFDMVPSYDVQLNQGDYIDFRIYVGGGTQTYSGGTLASLNTSKITIHLIAGSSQQAVSSNAISHPTVQRFLSGSGTYTRPAGVTSIKVSMVGGGGGGSGGQSGSSGSTGTASTFGTSLLTANPGVGATGGAGGAAGIGGTVTVNSPAIAIVAVSGGGGGQGAGAGASASVGGSSIFGGGGAGASTGGVGAANTGGGGAGGSNAGASYGGQGGGAGGGIIATINNPSLTYAYSVGGGGAGGGGTGSGGTGGSGVIIVEEFYGMNAPILIGSVTSNSTNALRVEAGRINCGTSSSITNLYGNSWMTTPSNISSGICTSTLSTGWSAAPSCVVTAANTGTVNDLTWKANATSATSLTLLCVAGGAACTGGGDINITCMGSR